jgi:hypothetical protein
MMFQIAEVDVVESKLSDIVVRLGKSADGQPIHLHIWIQMAHRVKPGTKLTLLAEIPDALIGPINGKPSNQAPLDRG